MSRQLHEPHTYAIARQQLLAAALLVATLFAAVLVFEVLPRRQEVRYWQAMLCGQAHQDEPKGAITECVMRLWNGED